MGAARRIEGLDGWRALFIGVVLFSHFGPKVAHFPDGQFGVRAFFVLSGFIITHLMLREAARDHRIGVLAFYKRRILRIWPVYAVFLAAMAVTQLVGQMSLGAPSWIGALTFTANFTVPLTDWPLYHLWSLAIEQQFYLAWPFLFLALKPWRRPGPALAALMAIAVAALLFRLGRFTLEFWLHPAPVMPAWVKPLLGGGSTLNYLDTLALGCAAAVWLFHNQPQLRPARAWGIGAAALAATLVWLWLPEGGAPGAFNGVVGPLVQAAGVAVLLAVSVIAPGPFAFMAWRPLRLLGLISYSVYMWQQPFTVVWLERWPAGARLAIVLAVATASYLVIERPILKRRSRGAAVAVTAA